MKTGYRRNRGSSRRLIVASALGLTVLLFPAAQALQAVPVCGDGDIEGTEDCMKCEPGRSAEVLAQVERARRRAGK